MAARVCGAAPLGSFFALCGDEDGAMLILGRCTGATAREAFTNAAAARAYFQDKMALTASQDGLAQARSDYAIEDMRTLAWSRTEPPAPTLVTLTDADTASRAAAYFEQNRDAAPVEVVANIELLFEPVGVFAAVAPA